VIKSIPVGERPVGVVVTRDGSRVYVAHGASNAVYVIDAHAMVVSGRIPVGQRAWYLSFTPDESRLYVACGRSNSVFVVDVAAAKVIATVPVGQLPFAVAIPK